MKTIKCTIKYGHTETDQDNPEHKTFVVEASDGFEIAFMEKNFMLGIVGQLPLTDEFVFQGSQTLTRLFRKICTLLKKG